MIVGALPAPISQMLQRGFQILVALIAMTLRFLSRFNGQGWLSVLWWAVGLTGTGLVGWLGFQGWRRWQRRRRLDRLAPVEQIYQQMLWVLDQQGYGKQASQTPLEYAAGLQQRSEFRHGHLVGHMVERYVGWRYGNQPADVDSLQTDLQTLRRAKR